MKLNSPQAGYTILEVMIFLVVSAFILVSALVMMNGRQDQIKHEQAVRDFDAQIRAAIADVSTGYFPNRAFGCQNAAGPFLDITASADEQGTKEDCVFAGKAIRQKPGENTLQVISMAAARSDIGDAFSLGDPDTKLTPVNTGAIDLTEEEPTAWGMHISRIANEAGNDLSYIAFLSGFGQLSAGGVLEPGTQPISLYVGDATQFIGSGSLSGGVPQQISSNDAVYFCLESADRSKNAVIIVGKDGRQLSTTIDQDAEGEYVQQCGF